MTTATEASAVEAMMPNAGTRRCGQPAEPRREEPVLGGGERHLGADHRPAVERADAGDDHGERDQVAGPGAAADDRVGGGGVGRLVAVQGQRAGGQDAEHGDQREQVDRRRWRACRRWSTCGTLRAGSRTLAAATDGGLDAEVAEQADRHRAADRRRGCCRRWRSTGVKLPAVMKNSPTVDIRASGMNLSTVVHTWNDAHVPDAGQVDRGRDPEADQGDDDRPADRAALVDEVSRRSRPSRRRWRRCRPRR